MWQQIMTNWNFFRAARLLLGIAAVIQALILHEWPLALAGLFIAGMALANAGCGLGGCAPQRTLHTQPNKNTAEITYEEVDTKK